MFSLSTKQGTDVVVWTLITQT